MYVSFSSRKDLLNNAGYVKNATCGALGNIVLDEPSGPQPVLLLGVVMGV